MSSENPQAVTITGEIKNQRNLVRTEGAVRKGLPCWTSWKQEIKLGPGGGKSELKPNMKPDDAVQNSKEVNRKQPISFRRGLKIFRDTLWCPNSCLWPPGNFVAVKAYSVALTAAARSWHGSQANTTLPFHGHHPRWALQGFSKITSQVKADWYCKIGKHMGNRTMEEDQQMARGQI